MYFALYESTIHHRRSPDTRPPAAHLTPARRSPACSLSSSPTAFNARPDEGDDLAVSLAGGEAATAGHRRAN
jgi:hypothetical protein